MAIRIASEVTPPHTSLPESIPFPPFERGLDIQKVRSRLEANHAIHLIDCRPGAKQPLATNLAERLNPGDNEAIVKFVKTTLKLTDQEMASLTGKTLAVTYTKFGDGHKHQALDMALKLAHTLQAQVILFDPMEGLPERERRLMDGAKGLHSALQHRNIREVDDIIADILAAPYPKDPLFHVFDYMTNHAAALIGAMAKFALPTEEDAMSDQATKQDPMGRLVSNLRSHTEWFTNVLEVMTASQVVLTEGSTACVTAAIAAHYGAEAIITAHPNAIRALTPNALNWLPKSLRPAALHALETIMLGVPDPGYTHRSMDPTKELHPSDQEQQDSLLVSSVFIVPRLLKKMAPWLRDAITVVADRKVAQDFHHHWGVSEERLAAIGTSGDTISPAEFSRKWAGNVYNVLLASNGNGSNIPDMHQAIREIGVFGDPHWLELHHYNLDLYLAKHADKLPSLIEELHRIGIRDDQIQVLDYTEDFDAGRAPQFDPKRAVHIALGRGDACTSDLKLWMQRRGHLEIRTGGENAMTGAAVGIVELLTPAGAFNETFNTIETTRRGVAAALNWPSSDYWRRHNVPAIDPHPHTTFPELLDFLLQPEAGKPILAEELALRAYTNVDRQSNQKMIGLLMFELANRLRKHKPHGAERINFIKQLIEYGKERDWHNNKQGLAYYDN